MYADFAVDFGKDVELELIREAEQTSMIVLVGATGAGKSHFINAISPASCSTSARLASCTQNPAAVSVTFDGKPLVLIDTPGFNDTRSHTGRSDALILSEIARLIAIQSAMGVKMKGILYLHDIFSARMTGDAIRQLDMLQKICGEDSWSHVTFVTTKWPDETTQSMLELGTKEADLRRLYWRPMLRKKARMFRFENNTLSAEAIVRSLIYQEPVKFALQREMESGKSLAETEAGRFVVGAREHDEQRYSELKMEASPRGNVEAEIEKLEHSVRERKEAEGMLQADVPAGVENELKTRVKEEFRGRKPTVVSIISFLVGLTSLAVNVLSMALSQ